MSSVMPSNPFSGMPSHLQKELAQLDRRLRMVSFLKGLGALTFFTLLLSALFLAVDYFFPLPGLVRFGFLTLLGMTFLWMFYQWLLLPLSRRRRWPELAYLIDRSFPDLQERVSSTVELTMERSGHPALDSEFMKDRLRQETDKKLTGIDLWECLSLNSMSVALFAGLLTALLVASPLLLNAGGYSLLWQRLLTPWQNLDSATNLTFVVENGDRVVPRGDDVLIHAVPKWRYHEGTLPREIRLRWTDERGNSESREMSYDSRKGAYVGKIPQVVSAITYELTSRAARSRTYAIQVADRPRLLDVTITVEPPAYTHHESTINEGGIGTIRAIEGSRLIADITFEYPVEQAEWVWNTPRIQLPVKDGEQSVTVSGSNVVTPVRIPGQLSPDGLSARIVAMADQSDGFVFDAVSSEQLHNIDEPQRLISVIPDRPPRIDLAGSSEPVKVRPDDIIPLEFLAGDDFGVMEMALEVELLSGGLEDPVVVRWESEKTGPEVRELTDHYELDLSRLDLKNGDILGYRAVARDGRPVPGPNEIWTSRRVLMINQEVKTLSGQEVEEFYTQMRRQAEIVKKEVERHRKEVQRHREELDPKPRSESLAEIEKIKPEWMQTKLALTLQTEDLSRQLNQRPITAALARMDVDPAQELIEKTAAELQKLEDDEGSKSLDMIREHEKELREAESLLNKLLNQLRDAERIEQELTELQQLSRRAKNLAEDAHQFQQKQSSENEGSAESEKETAKNASEQMEQAEEELNQADLDKLRGEFETLSQDLKNLLKRRPELKQAAKNSLLSELAEAATQAERLAEQQNQLTESTKESQQEMQESQQELNSALKETAELARELATRSEQDARTSAAPVFDAASSREAAQEQEKANLANAAEALQEAREALSRFEQARSETEALPNDTQQAARELAARSKELAEKLEQHEQEVKQRKESQKKLKDMLQRQEREKKPTTDEQLAQQSELAEMQKSQRVKEEQLGEELSGLMQATKGLNVPPNLSGVQRDAINKMDQASDALVQQNQQADNRLKDAERTLEHLANSLGTQQKRAQQSADRLKNIQQQSDQLAEQIQKASEQKEQADPNLGKNLADQQLNQIRQMLQMDAVDDEQELSSAVKQALDVQKKLEEAKFAEAKQSRDELGKQLQHMQDRLTKQQDKTNAEKSPQTADLETEEGDDPTKNNEDENVAEETATAQQQQQAWEDVPLSPELRNLRFPIDSSDPEKMLHEMDQIAAEQQKLNERAAQVAAEPVDPQKPNKLRDEFNRIANEQRRLAERTERVTGNTSALPRMKAAKAQRKAEDSLRETDPDNTMQEQQAALDQLNQAREQLSQELETRSPQDSTETPLPAEELSKQLDKQLAELEQEIVRAVKGQSMPLTNSEDANNQPAETDQSKETESPAAAEMSNEELLQALQQMRESQQRIAEQTSQLAEQSQLERPDEKDLNASMQAAKESTAATGQQMDRGQLQAAAEQANQAQQKLQQAAESGLQSDAAQEAVENLAEQQQELLQKMQQLAGSTQAVQQAQEAQQMDLQQQAEALAAALQKLAEDSRAKPIDERRNADALDKLQEQAGQAADNMQEALTEGQQGNLQQSASASNQASQQLSSLAEQTQKLSDQKRDTIVPEPVGDEAAQASRTLEQAEASIKEALEQAMAQQQQAAANAKNASQNGQDKPSHNQQDSNAGQQANSSQTGENPAQTGQQSSAAAKPGSQQPSQQAPTAMQQLAQQLAQAAQALDQAHQKLQPNQQPSAQMAEQSQSQQESGQPSENAESESGNQSALTGDQEMDGSVLRSALMRDWGQRQGELETDLLDAKRRSIDQEYAPFIQRYFESLANEQEK